MRRTNYPAAVLCLLAGVLAGQTLAPPPRPPENRGVTAEIDAAKQAEVLSQLRSGKEKQALAQATELLRQYPDSVWLNCAAGEAALAVGDGLSVHLALERLKPLVDEKDANCVSKLKSQSERSSQMAVVRGRTLTLVRAGKLEEAERQVAGTQLEASEQLLLEHYLDRAQTHFATALSRLGRLAKISPAAAQQAGSLREETTRQAREFSELRARERVFLFDPISTSACTPAAARNMFGSKGLTLDGFLSTARDLVREYPSNPDAQQFYFMALLLAGSSNSLNEYGDGVLARYGCLTIPFFSRANLLLLTLDRSQRRIQLQRNTAHPANLGLTVGLQDDQLFDLSYAEVKSLRQYVSSDLNTLGLSARSAAIDLGQQGKAPYYALMTAIHCLYGERFERRATERLGRFLAGELSLPANRVQLVNPEGQTRDVFGGFVDSITVASMAARQAAIQHQQQAATNENARQTLAQQQAQADLIESSGQSLLDQRRDESDARRGWAREQLSQSASLEETLIDQGFRQAASLDVPEYLDMLAGMLSNDSKTEKSIH